VCIAGNGTSPKRMIIVPRLTFEQGVYEIGSTPDHAMVEYQENGFISRHLFEKLTTSVFFAGVEEVHERVGSRSWGTMLLDSCSCHHSDAFLNM
jgi:hypothetical protein